MISIYYFEIAEKTFKNANFGHSFKWISVPNSFILNCFSYLFNLKSIAVLAILITRDNLKMILENQTGQTVLQQQSAHN